MEVVGSIPLRETVGHSEGGLLPRRKLVGGREYIPIVYTFSQRPVISLMKPVTRGEALCTWDTDFVIHIK